MVAVPYSYLVTWRNRHAVYTPEEASELKGLPARESFLIHSLKAFTDGQLAVSPSKPPRFETITLVASSRLQAEKATEELVDSLRRRYPGCGFVLGDSSHVETDAAWWAEAQGCEVEVIEKAPKGSWDEGPDIRDERVVGKSTIVVLCDDSSRAKRYKTLAKRMGRHVEEAPVGASV